MIDDIGDDQRQRHDHRPAGKRGDLAPGFAEVDLTQEEPQERACRCRADADADEVPAPPWHVGVSMRAGVGLLTEQGGRFSGRREVAIGLGVYALYLLASRASAARRAAPGARNAERVVAVERRLGIHVEPALQEPLLRHRRLLGVLNVAYVVLERRAHGRLPDEPLRPRATPSSTASVALQC